MRTLVLAAGLLLLTSCGKPGLAGNGAQRTEVRTIGGFTRLDASTAVEVAVTRGAAGPLTVTADENLLPLLETEVNAGQLRVRFKTDVRPTVAKVVVRAPLLDDVRGSAGARVEAEGIDEDRVAVLASSGANVHVLGKAKALDARASSGAVLDASGLATPSVELHASSGATVHLGAPEAVRGDASSGATVRLRAEPRTNAVTTSSGATVKVDH